MSSKYDCKRKEVELLIKSGKWLEEVCSETSIPIGSITYLLGRWGIEYDRKAMGYHRANACKSISKQLKERHEIGLMPKNPNGYGGNCKVRGEWVSQQECKEELEYYVDQDLTNVQISELMGTDIKTVYNWLKKFGLQRPRRKGERSPQWKGGNFDHYRGADWYLQRKVALERDTNSCTKCGLTMEEHKQKYSVSLHVHHIIPYRISENNSLDNLMTLCVGCHNIAHAEGEYSKGNLSYRK